MSIYHNPIYAVIARPTWRLHKTDTQNKHIQTYRIWCLCKWSLLHKKLTGQQPNVLIL